MRGGKEGEKEGKEWKGRDNSVRRDGSSLAGLVGEASKANVLYRHG
jgi:hypothetical protein